MLGLRSQNLSGTFYSLLSAIWLAMASLIYVLDFEKAKGEKKNADRDEVEERVELTHEYHSGLAL